MESGSGQATHAMEPWVKLENKVVMVTGASSGLGLDFCLDLAKAGCRILAAARRIDRLQSLCDEINNMARSSSSNEYGPAAVAIELDVNASGSVIEASVQKAWDAFGRIDALINNAGVRDFSARNSSSHEPTRSHVENLLLVGHMRDLKLRL